MGSCTYCIFCLMCNFILIEKEKDVLKNFTKFTGKCLHWSLSFKVCGLQIY